MLKKIRHTFELIKFSHTVFALPFALVAYFMATQGKLATPTLLWVVVCLVTARTAAMAFNRLVDAPQDALNPRTKGRHLPAGVLSRRYVWILIFISSVIFIFSASQLNTLALYLSPLCLLLLFLYSLTKRFTHYTPLFLGLSLGMAPLGANIAVTGHINLSSALLGLAVLFWVSGFDLLYALQDLDFDRTNGVYSWPVKLGTPNTFRLAIIFHVLFLLILLAYGFLEGMGEIYWIGLTVAAGFLIWEHWILDAKLEKIQAAFFTANGLLSVFFLFFVLADLYL